ncbi:uncharacterized protein BKA78DRAFT_27209 [Phyllosticta capitalensis]|uniref:uncharacterized protein n=1 Tax=Phyllosticta capitalensis TaxID=121624 RepID=UPI00312EE1A0
MTVSDRSMAALGPSSVSCMGRCMRAGSIMMSGRVCIKKLVDAMERVCEKRALITHPSRAAKHKWHATRRILTGAHQGKTCHLISSSRNLRVSAPSASAVKHCALASSKSHRRPKVVVDSSNQVSLRAKQPNHGRQPRSRGIHACHRETRRQQQKMRWAL